MPINAQTAQAMLATPVPTPGNNSYNPWQDYDVNSVDDMGVNADAMGDIDTFDLTRTASNVGGIVKESKDPTEWATDVPELTDPLEEQTNTFIDAYDQGYTATEDSRQEYAALGAAAGSTLGAVGAPIGATVGWLMGDKEGDRGEAGTMRAARMARREDRLTDMQTRQKAQEGMYDDLVAGGMKKGKARRQARRMKRELRKGQRAERKDAWKTFKGE